MNRYEGKKAVVIGGTTGMGYATAKALIEEGVEVLVTGTSERNLESARAGLGPSAHVVRSDLASLADVDALGTTVAELLGTVDFAFLNAGIADLGPVEKVTEAAYDRQFDVNTKGIFFTAQRLIPLMRDGGSYVFTTSVTNFSGTAGMGVFSGTKAALHAFAKVLAAELVPRGIRVNSVSPGFIRTPTMGSAGMSAEERAALEAEGDAVTPMRRHGTVEEVAAAVLFLAFDATFTTGVELDVTGGLGPQLFRAS